jgi:hypothetical protein
MSYRLHFLRVSEREGKRTAGRASPSYIMTPTRPSGKYFAVPRGGDFLIFLRQAFFLASIAYLLDTPYY